jgi:hypothetical protein
MIIFFANKRRCAPAELDAMLRAGLPFVPGGLAVWAEARARGAHVPPVGDLGDGPADSDGPAAGPAAGPA